MVDKKIHKKKLKVIVFGGSGFIGSHVAESLYKKGFQVTVADLKKCEDLNKNISFQKVDINNQKRVINLVKNSSIVFNFAAIADIQDSYDESTDAIELLDSVESKIFAISEGNIKKKYSKWLPE